MAMLPDSLKLTSAEQKKLDEIRVKAKYRHEKNRKLAKLRGQKDFPMLPYECSWAYEEEFRRKIRKQTYIIGW